jgi:hypothetical protein
MSEPTPAERMRVIDWERRRIEREQEAMAADSDYCQCVVSRCNGSEYCANCGKLLRPLPKKK